MYVLDNRNKYQDNIKTIIVTIIHTVVWSLIHTYCTRIELHRVVQQLSLVCSSTYVHYLVSKWADPCFATTRMQSAQKKYTLSKSSMIAREEVQKVDLLYQVIY